jgi:hypothetical protein
MSAKLGINPQTVRYKLGRSSAAFTLQEVRPVNVRIAEARWLLERARSKRLLLQLDRNASQSLAFMLLDGACGSPTCLAGESVQR